ncbi:hypothetical protein [Bacillus albus]|nr:hypothetical protein [Bacillus albus]
MKRRWVSLEITSIIVNKLIKLNEYNRELKMALHVKEAFDTDVVVEVI